jgi:hypothetical protein
MNIGTQAVEQIPNFCVVFFITLQISSEVRDKKTEVIFFFVYFIFSVIYSNGTDLIVQLFFSCFPKNRQMIILASYLVHNCIYKPL